MKRELSYAVSGLRRRRRPAWELLFWCLVEAAPAAVSGKAVARALDKGFLVDRPMTGLAWLGVLLGAVIVGAIGSGQVYRRLADLVEPFRDDLVRRIVNSSLAHAVEGRRDEGAVARISRQAEIVRDTYAGLIALLNGFIVTVVGVVIGLLSIEPLIVVLMIPPFVLGLLLFLSTLGMASGRQRASVLADEDVAAAADTIITGIRDIVATGTQDHAAGLARGPIQEQAAAERAVAKIAALRTLCFAVSGWGPLIVLLAASPWLVRHGLSAGGIMGGLTYVLFGLQPALRNLHSGLGNAGVKFIVTLGRILDASAESEVRPVRATRPEDHHLLVRRLTFAYGPHAEPVLRDLDLSIPPGDHLAIVGPSGIGKSTLAGLLCGLLTPGSGTVYVGGTPAAELSPSALSQLRVLIPQEAYVFSGTVWENLAYLRPSAGPIEADRAVTAVGAEGLVRRLGGYAATIDPSELSAGERQLIALVRAYLSSAPIAVLDEATCHLDPVAERQAEEAFAAREGTVIVIAHRISSALRARRVLVLDGRTAQVGDHRSLLQTSALYRELLGHWEAAPPAGDVAVNSFRPRRDRPAARPRPAAEQPGR